MKSKSTSNPREKSLTAVYLSDRRSTQNRSIYSKNDEKKIYNKCCINLIKTVIRKAARIITDRAELNRAERSQASRLRRLKVKEQIKSHFLLKCESCRAVVMFFFASLWQRRDFHPVFSLSFHSLWFYVIPCVSVCERLQKKNQSVK